LFGKEVFLMKIGFPTESLAGETRVSATPKSVSQLIKLGFDVAVESGAGALASYTDAAYRAAGAEVVEHAAVWQADIIYKLNQPSEAETQLLHSGQTLVSFLSPFQNADLIKTLQEKNVTALAMDMVPRISRAQSLDALSSMANIGGYRAVVEAAQHFGRFFTGQITAAGKVPPAKVLIIGAGVAGLAAIGTANSLGAIVRAFDTRLEVAEQIESMGGQFLKLNFASDEDGSTTGGYAKTMSQEFLDAEMALFREQAKEVDIIITTAQIPGKRAPILVTKDMVDSMQAGSVIVDMSASSGGNCEYTVPGEIITTDSGVKVIGYTDLPGRLPTQSSDMYATNLVNLTKLLSPEKDGNINVNFEDTVLRNMTVVKAGVVTFPPPPISVTATPPKTVSPAPAPIETAPKKKKTGLKLCGAILAVLLFGLIGYYAPAAFLGHFTVFVLACVVGYYVVWNVTHALHTPLMSVTNAISGIIVVGALLQIKADSSVVITILSVLAILIATINIVGGFTVTQRMLRMFRKE
jgi:NAD(P) transhydrogenase subunit alpha